MARFFWCQKCDVVARRRGRRSGTMCRVQCAGSGHWLVGSARFFLHRGAARVKLSIFNASPLHFAAALSMVRMTIR